MAVAVHFWYIMRLDVSRPGVRLHGRQVYLPLLVILMSHVLMMMMTPLHDALLLERRASDGVVAAHAVHAAHVDCVGLTATGAHHGSDCGIRGTAPSRSAPSLLVGSAPVGRPEPLPLDGLLPAPPERTTWPAPLPDLHVLFQVFRL